jgi:hypothetical protein
MILFLTLNHIAPCQSNAATSTGSDRDGRRKPDSEQPNPWYCASRT